jgi:hypothetical protein
MRTALAARFVPRFIPLPPLLPALAAAALFGLGVLVHTTGLVDELASRWEDITFLSQQHMKMVAISGGLAILCGVLFGILLTRPAVRWMA